MRSPAVERSDALKGEGVRTHLRLGLWSAVLRLLRGEESIGSSLGGPTSRGGVASLTDPFSRGGLALRGISSGREQIILRPLSSGVEFTLSSRKQVRFGKLLLPSEELRVLLLMAGTVEERDGDGCGTLLLTSQERESDGRDSPSLTPEVERDDDCCGSLSLTPEVEWDDDRCGSPSPPSEVERGVVDGCGSRCRSDGGLKWQSLGGSGRTPTSKTE